MIRPLFLLILLLSPALHAETVLRSSPSQALLVELYTSEGCSSCPPADRWLSGLAGHPGLWSSLVPVAFHVDYWDRLGWRDRFARPEFSERQRRYRREGELGTVYTPGLLANGREWRNFSWRPPETGTGADVGTLELRLDGAALAARFEPAAGAEAASVEGPLELSVALLGAGLRTDVRAGENAGRRLGHDFVVLGFRSLPLERRGDVFTAQTRLPAHETDAERLAVAAWVSPRGALKPVQATGGWLPTPP